MENALGAACSRVPLRVSRVSARHCRYRYIYIYTHAHVQMYSVLKNLYNVTNKVQLAHESVQKMGVREILKLPA